PSGTSPSTHPVFDLPPQNGSALIGNFSEFDVSAGKSGSERLGEVQGRGALFVLPPIFTHLGAVRAELALPEKREVRAACVPEIPGYVPKGCSVGRS
ncbi:MAG: hypothetical protein AAGA96_16930, partial [Verrucomicrobiota bacterium]